MGRKAAPSFCPFLPGIIEAPEICQEHSRFPTRKNVPKILSPGQVLLCLPSVFSLPSLVPGWAAEGSQSLPPVSAAPLGLTDEEVGIGCGGAILLLQELVEECGEASDDRGEGALSQDHQHEEWVHQELQEDAGKPCKQVAVRGQVFEGGSHHGVL